LWSASPPHVLRDYALLADGERGILVGPRGDFVWMCAPRWDSEAVFSSLIGGGGVYAITPVGRFVWGGYYEDGSLIWRSRWVTEEGIIECREALALPADPARPIVLRRLLALDAPARVRVRLEPRGDYGRRQAGALRLEQGIWSARCGRLYLRWRGGEEARPERGGGGAQALALELVLPAGGRHDFVLELADHAGSDDPLDPERAWEATAQAWAGRVPALATSLARRDARHAYAVLCGLTSATGGMVAAATMSLPERAEAGRNYDYRYVWIRDQCYAGQAAAAAGAPALVDEAVRFVTERLFADGPRLRPAYTTRGGPVPDQRSLGLAGYPGGGDVVGNRVNRQFQLDVFGEALLLFAAAARGGRLDGEGWRAAELAADAVAARWREPDAGIWEIDARPWTHSRLICAAGLRAAAEAGAPASRAPRWVALADAILADTAASALHPSGRWQRSPADPGLDGALLMPPIRGGVAADDPRTLATQRAYAQELTDDGYAYRFRQDRRPLGEAEGAFLLCGFLMALAAHQQGDAVTATRWFERNRGACGTPGLFSEEYDVAQRQLRGNLPQAFVHALLLECAARLGGPWRPE
jgi:hypothetical protein